MKDKRPSTIELRAAGSPSVNPRKKPTAPEPEDEDIDPEAIEEEGEADSAPDDEEVDTDDEGDENDTDDEGTPQVADSPGNRASTPDDSDGEEADEDVRTTADDELDIDAAPDVAGTASEGTVVFGGAWGFANDMMHQWRESLNKNTGKLYFTHLHRFFSWCSAQGWTPISMPEDALVQYSATITPANGQFAISALKSFTKGGYTSHLQLAPLEYPRIKRPPPKKKKKADDMSMDAEIPDPVAPRGSVTDFSDRMATDTRGEPTRRPMPPRIGGDAMIRPRPAARRESTAPLTDFLPPRGRFRLFKRPEQGPMAGRRVAVGGGGKDMFFQSDIQGFPDIAAYINAKIVPKYGPFPGQPPLTYEIEVLDENGRPVPPNTEIIIEAPMNDDGTGPRRNGYSMDGEDKFSAMEKEWMEDRRRDRERLEQLMNKRGESGDSIALMLREFDRSTSDMSAKMDRKLDELRAEVRRNAASASLAVQSSGPDPSAEAVKTFANIAERSLDKAIAQAHREPVMHQQADPIALITSVMGLMKGMMPTQPTTDPATLALLASIAEGQKQTAQLIASLVNNKPTETLEDQLERTAKTIAFAREISGGGGEAAPSGGGAEAVAHAIKDVLSAPVLIEATRSFRNGNNGSNRKAVTRGGGSNAARGTREAPALPESAANALHGIREATNDEEIQSALLEFLQALQDSGTDFWLTKLHRIGEAFRGLESEEEIVPFVVNFLKEIGQGNLVREAPGLVTRVSKALAGNYSNLHALLTGGEEKTLIRPETPKAAQPTPTKQNDGPPPEPARAPVPRREAPTVVPDTPSQRKAQGVVVEAKAEVVAEQAAAPVDPKAPSTVEEPPPEDGDFGEESGEAPAEEDGDLGDSAPDAD